MIRLTKKEISLLTLLTEEGPLYHLTIPYQKSLIPLVKMGLIARVVVKGQVDFWTATDEGLEYYCKYFNVGSVQESLARRVVITAIKKAQQDSRDFYNDN